MKRPFEFKAPAAIKPAPRAVVSKRGDDIGVQRKILRSETRSGAFAPQKIGPRPASEATSRMMNRGVQGTQLPNRQAVMKGAPPNRPQPTTYGRSSVTSRPDAGMPRRVD